MTNEEIRNEVDKMVAARFGLTSSDIRNMREYEEIHGKFHPLQNLDSCVKVAKEWKEAESKK